MKCAVHTDVDATGYCRNCGRALCAQCAREVRGALYCEECLARVMAGPASGAAGSVYAPPTPAGAPNPGVAVLLGFVPGLGAVYNGQYIKGLVHLLIFAGLIGLLNTDSTPEGMQAMAGILLGVFYCYMPIEAYMTAKAKLMGQAPPAFFGEAAAAPAEGEGPSTRRIPTGAIVLIVIGAVFLMANFGLFDRLYFFRFWPLILIGIGAWLLWKRVR